MRLRVATFNIHHGVGADGRLDLARTADVISATGASVVGLQEVDRALSARSGWVDQAAWLGERLGMDVVHGATIDRDPPDPSMPDGPRRRYGNALLSAHPVRSWQAVRLPGDPRREARGLVDAVVDVGGTTVRVAVTHLQNRSRGTRREQAAHVVDLLGGRRGPSGADGPPRRHERGTRHVRDAHADRGAGGRVGRGRGRTRPHLRGRGARSPASTTCSCRAT